jgi:cell division transport system ATP-binding protein
MRDIWSNFNHAMSASMQIDDINTRTSLCKHYNMKQVCVGGQSWHTRVQIDGRCMIRLTDIILRYEAGAGRPGGVTVPRDRRAGQEAVTVLNGISLEVPQGGFRWLLGPSGAGKSSLLRLLHLAVRPSAGSLEVLGLDITRARREQLPRLRQRIGMVFQDFRLLPHLSAYDNVALPQRLAGRPEAELRAEVTELLRWVGLSGKGDVSPAALSGGEQQRIAIARAVINRPDLLLADEPTGNLDDAQAQKLMRLLTELNEMGTTVIVATHNEHLVAERPAHVLRLEEGRKVADG